MGVREAMVPRMVAELISGDAGLGGEIGKAEPLLDDPGAGAGIAGWGGWGCVGVFGEEIKLSDELLGLGYGEIGIGRETEIVRD